MELRIGLIGTGAIGRTHIERINNRLRGGRVVAVSDVNADFGRAVAEQYGCRFFETGEDLIAGADVDAVIITTTDEYHARFSIAALRAGKFVFCEKPLAPTPDECRAIMQAEMEGGRRLLQVGFMRRYDNGYRQLRKALQSGKFGAPLVLHCAHRVPSMPDYWNTSMPVENSMIHEIDILRWLLGEDYASVQVVFGKQTRHADPSRLRDPQIMMLTTQSGIRIDVEAFSSCGYAYEIKCEVVCEDGILNLPDTPFLVTRANAACSRALYTDWADRFAEAYDVEFQEWLDATLAGRVDGPTVWDGYLGQVTAAAASRSRDTGTIVPIEPLTRPAFYD